MPGGTVRGGTCAECAHALASIHTRATLPYLAALLDDPVLDLRAEAVGGMASFANGLPVQITADLTSMRYLQFPEKAPYLTPETRANFGMGKFTIEQDEARYLSCWRTWWAEHRGELGY